nr:hydrolase [Mimivirus sp.]
MILVSQKFYTDKITEYVLPIYVSSKETYISYFVKVKYIIENDLPKAEDIHINYEDRYLRDCQWFTLDEILNLCEKDFHKRLQITRIQQRITKYYEKGLFS